MNTHKITNSSQAIQTQTNNNQKFTKHLILLGDIVITHNHDKMMLKITSTHILLFFKRLDKKNHRSNIFPTCIIFKRCFEDRSFRIRYVDPCNTSKF